MIKEFRGENYFLSNFYNVKVVHEGIEYLNNEAAFQACKLKNVKDRVKFSNLDPSSAKKLGRKVKLRSDWEEVKEQYMYEVCKAKFTQNKSLLKKLLETKNEVLVEGNTWNDKIWGVCNGEGENKLGKILMKVREELK